MKYIKFKAIVLLLIVGFFTVPAFAACDNINVPGLSDAEEAKLKLSCQQALVNATETPDISTLASGLTDPNKLSAYGIVAQEWAKALGIAATELGIAVDTFLDTDAGKLTAFIIIWQVMGETILGFLIGIPLLIVIMWLGIRTAQRAKIRGIEYSETKKSSEATFCIGYCHLLQGEFDRAHDAFNIVANDYPGNPYASKARLCLHRLEGMSE